MNKKVFLISVCIFIGIMLVLVGLNILGAIKFIKNNKQNEETQGYANQENQNNIDIKKQVVLPVFLYHRVKPDINENDYADMVKTTEKFEEDLKYLADNGYKTITIDDLNRHLYKGKRLSKKAVMITFDDGYYDNYEYAYPLLKQYKMHGIVYMIGWSVGRDTFIKNDKPIIPHFTWEQAREMQDSGVMEFGVHSFDMHNNEGVSYGYEKKCGLGLLPYENEEKDTYYQRIYEDLKKAKDIMETELNTEIPSIAYPYGEYNDTVIEILKELDLQVSFLAKLNDKQETPYTLSRIYINNDISIQSILGEGSN